MFFQEKVLELEISHIIARAESALASRNFPEFIHVFAEIWGDVSKPPHFDQFVEKGELLHLAGEFLVHYGKAHNLVNYQERGKNLLQQAIELFDLYNQPEKVLNSQIVLGTAYFQEGAKEEYAAYLYDAEMKYRGDKSDSNYHRLQINLIIYELETSNITAASKRVTRSLAYFRKCSNLKIKIQFFIEAGITFRRLGNIEQAVSFFNEAFDLALASRNSQYQTLILNNLSFAYRSGGELERAHKYADKALKLAEDQPGWKANLLDTKAQIYFDQREFENAEATIDQSINLFRQGEDFGGLCEALWLKSQILMNLDLRELAFETFIECHQTAAMRISGEESRRYINKFTELMPIVSGNNIFEKMDSYKRNLIEKALIKSKGKITDAANILGIDHRSLSAMMKNFPSLYSDLGIKRRTRSSAK